MTGRIAGTPVEVYLDALASDAPTPGDVQRNLGRG